MRRDLILGILISALLHGGVFFGDRLVKFKPKPPPPPEEKPKIMLFDMPKLEPEEPEKVDTTEEAPQKVDIAPPMLTDVPQIATDTSFVQKLQPPPPDATKPKV